MEMVDLAREAYRCSNFDLALGIYDKLLLKFGPKMEWLIGKASSLAHQNRFNEAVNAFYYAQRVGSLTPLSLLELVEAVTTYINLHSKKTIHKLKTVEADLEPLFCGICYGILFEPATLPCGHSFCKDCISSSKYVQTCQICHKHHKGLMSSKVCVNVVLSQLMSKFFPNQTKGRLLKREGNKLFQEGKNAESLEKYSQAVKQEPCDHLSLSNRSHVYASQGNFTEALKDAESVCQLKPYWPKGYYRKGAALQGLHHYERALLAYLQCVTLDPTISSAKEALCKVMHKLLTHSHGSYTKRAEIGHGLFTASFERDWDSGVPLNIFTAGLSQLIGLVLRGFQECVQMEEAKRRKSEEEDKAITISKRDSPINAQSSSSDYVLEDTQERKKAKSDVNWILSTGGKDLKKIEVDPGLVAVSDLECSLCYRLLFQPVTTPCGHVFCRSCLYRCLDYGKECPLCKGCLSFFLAERYQEETHALGHILRKYLPEAFHERETKHYAELRELSKNSETEGSEIPIFICTQAFPKVPCPLHVFEPRYRLMIRQCVESGSRQFGMCTPSSASNDVGVMLHVREVRHLPDGRAIVDTIGSRRFRVLDRGMRDGYHTAKYELLQDSPEEGEEYARLVELNNTVYQKAKRWMENLHLLHRIRIEDHFGRMPENQATIQESPDGPDWVWYVLAILPLDPPTQGIIVGKNSLRQRLLDIQHVLNRIMPSDS